MRGIAVVAVSMWFVFALADVAAAQVVNPAQSMNPWEKIKIGEFVQTLKFGGDFRLRDEDLRRIGPGVNRRHRERFRLRLSADIMMPYDLQTSLRFASGTGEQTSTNQSFDNLSSQKSIWIDLAYLRWAPYVSDDGGFYLSGGRMPNPLWRMYSSDLIWDDDVNPEGFAEGVEWLLPVAAVNVFVNAMQAVADEDAADPRGQWVFSQQAGVETRLPWQSRIRFAGAYHKWSAIERDSLSQTAVNQGNRRIAGVLANRFGVAEVTSEFSCWLGGLPLALQTTLARNLRAKDGLAGPRADNGYQYGTILGRAKARGSWELAWFLKYAQTDVSVADVADSDFGDGGTNRRGHIAWAAYNPEEWLQAKVKYFATRVIDEDLAPGPGSVLRVQADVSVKF
ncbi:MAG: putative porin [Elusimicrobiota bacterium]